jgi:DNA-binding response OmpR family regulator
MSEPSMDVAWRLVRIPLTDVAKRILVVDDDEAIRRLVRAVLAREGYELETAAGGTAAINKLSVTSFDAVLLDLMMSEGSGFDVIDYLERERPDAKCILVISAASDTLINAITSPIVAAKLRKPFEIKELLAVIRKCTG